MTTIVRNPDWATTTAGRELIDWLYVIARRRAAALALVAAERHDVAHEAVAWTVHGLHRSSTRYLTAANPAAVLERVVARRIAEAHHRARMSGLSGAAANGRNLRIAYPRRIGGDAAQRILEQLPTPTFRTSRSVDRAAAIVQQWVQDELNVALDADALHATIYVLERIAVGVSRNSLLRGGHNALSADPALRHLGFTASTARTFAVWLLGKQENRHRHDGQSAAVLDAALLDEPVSPATRERLHDVAVASGFVHNNHGRRPSSRSA